VNRIDPDRNDLTDAVRKLTASYICEDEVSSSKITPQAVHAVVRRASFRQEARWVYRLAIASHWFAGYPFSSLPPRLKASLRR
jgi:hypothetical protein